MVSILIIGTVLFGSFLGALGTLLFKQEIGKGNLRSLIKVPRAYLATFLLGISVVLYLWMLRFESLSLIYPLASTTYIWVALFSVKMLGEKMNMWKYWGLVFIIFGTVLIGIAS
jgi:uncharacterized membrane protein